MKEHRAELKEHRMLFEKSFQRMDLTYQVIISHSEKIDANTEIIRRHTIDIEEMRAQTRNIQKQTVEISLRMKGISRRLG